MCGRKVANTSDNDTFSRHTTIAICDGDDQNAFVYAHTLLKIIFHLISIPQFLANTTILIGLLSIWITLRSNRNFIDWIAIGPHFSVILYNIKLSGLVGYNCIVYSILFDIHRMDYAVWMIFSINHSLHRVHNHTFLWFTFILLTISILIISLISMDQNETKWKKKNPTNLWIFTVRGWQSCLWNFHS